MAAPFAPRAIAVVALSAILVGVAVAVAVVVRGRSRELRFGDDPATPAGPSTTDSIFSYARTDGSGERHAVIDTAAARGLRPIPLVHATFGAEATLARVDTGANVNAAAGWLAHRAGALVEDAGATSEDHVGAELPLGRTAASLAAIDGWGPLAAGGRLVVVEEGEGSRSARSGIGLTISPQRLADVERASGRAVVLDFPAAAMRVVGEDEAELLLAGRAFDVSTDAHVRTCNGSFYLEAGVAGAPVSLLIDTGASISTLDAASRGARALADRGGGIAATHGTGEALSGDVPVTTYAAVALRIGKWETTGDVDVLARRSGYGRRCGTDGALGFDVLRSCVLVLGPRPDTLRARCGGV